MDWLNYWTAIIFMCVAILLMSDGGLDYFEDIGNSLINGVTSLITKIL